MSFFDNLTKEDTDIAYDTIRREYNSFAVLCGIYPNLKPGYYRIMSIAQFSIFFAILTVNTIALGITAYLTLDDETLLTQSIHFIFMNIIAFTMLISSIYSRPCFTRFHNDIGRNVQPYDQDTMNTVDSLKIYLKKLQKIVNIIFPCYLFFFGTLIVSLGPIADYFIGEFGKEIYNEQGVSLNLAIPCWTPFGSNTTIGYIISTSFQVGDHYIIVTNVLVINLFLAVALKHIYTELQLLITALNRLPERTANMYQKIYGKDYKGQITEYHENTQLQYCYNECIKESIKHHQRIIGLIHEVNKILDKFLIVFFFISSISIAISGILLMFGNGKLTTVMNAIIMGSTEVFDVFYICWCGKTISEASELLYITLYKTNWFNANKESGKLILIMMSKAKKPLTLYFNSITKLPANFETFATVVNTTYSYFNLLYAFREEATKL